MRNKKHEQKLHDLVLICKTYSLKKEKEKMAVMTKKYEQKLQDLVPILNKQNNSIVMFDSKCARGH
jgi:hypothetical protein